MKKVTIYSTRICPYCVRAKNFFQKRDIAYEDIMVDMDQEQLKIMMEKSKRQSVPQIFIGDYHVGGFDDLVEHGVVDRIWRKNYRIHRRINFFTITPFFNVR